jgi:hypothetical protein
MSVVATLVIIMALSPSPPSASEQTKSPPSAQVQNHAPKHESFSPTPRRRSFHAASKRRERAVDLGFFKPKPSSPANAYIEVPKELRSLAKDIIKGKVLKTTRESQTGLPAHSTRLASLAAFKANFTSKEEFNNDAKIIKRQNAANHGSPKKRTPWADIQDDPEENFSSKIQSALTNGTLTIIETMTLNKTISDLQGWINWWQNHEQPHKGTIVPSHATPPNPPSPPLLTCPVMTKSAQEDPPNNDSNDSNNNENSIGMHLTTRKILMEIIGIYDSEDLDAITAKILGTYEIRKNVRSPSPAT